MTCDPMWLEACAYGELDPAEAARASAHVARCARCAEELRWLQAEHRMVHGRPLRAVPSAVRKGVEARWPPPRASTPRWVPLMGVAAAFALAMVLSIRPARPTSASAACEPVEQGRDQIDRVEAGFGACLVATPADATYAASRL
jgi:anti-sigma factor RsiW